MKRIGIIIAGLLAGLVGLFMSVCGGRFFISFAVNATKESSARMPAAGVLFYLVILAFAGGCVVIGVLFIVRAGRKIGKAMGSETDDD